MNWWCDSHIWHYTTFITLALNGGSWYKQEKAKVPYSVYVLLQALKKIRLEKPQTARNSFSRKKAAKTTNISVFLNGGAKQLQVKHIKQAPPFSTKTLKG